MEKEYDNFDTNKIIKTELSKIDITYEFMKQFQHILLCDTQDGTQQEIQFAEVTTMANKDNGIVTPIINATIMIPLDGDLRDKFSKMIKNYFENNK